MCEACSSNCKACSVTANNCDSCFTGNGMILQGVSPSKSCSCPDGSSELSTPNVCETCGTNCKTCQGTSDNCDSCLAPFLLHDNKCGCMDGLFQSGTTQCSSCHATCLTCSSSALPGDCLTCRDTYKKVVQTPGGVTPPRGLCICEDGTFEQEINSVL